MNYNEVNGLGVIGWLVIRRGGVNSLLSPKSRDFWTWRMRYFSFSWNRIILVSWCEKSLSPQIWQKQTNGLNASSPVKPNSHKRHNDIRSVNWYNSIIATKQHKHNDISKKTDIFLVSFCRCSHYRQAIISLCRDVASVLCRFQHWN